MKRHPLATVESFFHVRHEDGTVQFFTEPLPPRTAASWSGTPWCPTPCCGSRPVSDGPSLTPDVRMNPS